MRETKRAQDKEEARASSNEFRLPHARSCRREISHTHGGTVLGWSGGADPIQGGCPREGMCKTNLKPGDQQDRGTKSNEADSNESASKAAGFHAPDLNR